MRRSSPILVFATLADHDGAPIVLADTGGAARTGWAAAAVLLSLGVPEDQVLDDYLLTNRYRGPVSDAFVASREG